MVEVNAQQPIDQSIKALLIVSPENALSDDELRNIDAYVMKGGSLGVFGGSLKVKQEQAELTASPVNTGINRLRWRGGSRGVDEGRAGACAITPAETATTDRRRTAGPGRAGTSTRRRAARPPRRAPAA